MLWLRRVRAKEWHTLVQNMQRMYELGNSPVDLHIELNSWESPADAIRDAILRNAAEVLSSHIHRVQRLSISFCEPEWYNRLASELLGSRNTGTAGVGASILEKVQLNLGGFQASPPLRPLPLTGYPAVISLSSYGVPKIGESPWAKNLRSLKLTSAVPLSQILDVLMSTTTLRVLKLCSGTSRESISVNLNDTKLHSGLAPLQVFVYAVNMGLAEYNSEVRGRIIQWREFSNILPDLHYIPRLSLCHSWSRSFVDPEDVLGGSIGMTLRRLRALYLHVDLSAWGNSLESRSLKARVASIDFDGRRRLFETRVRALTAWGDHPRRGFSSIQRLAVAAADWDKVCDILDGSRQEDFDCLFNVILEVAACIPHNKRVKDGFQVRIDRPVRNNPFPNSQANPERVDETHRLYARNLRELTIVRGVLGSSSVEGISSAQLHPTTALKLIRRFDCIEDGRKLPRLRLVNVRLALYKDEGDEMMDLLRQHVEVISEVKQVVTLQNRFMPSWAFEDGGVFFK